MSGLRSNFKVKNEKQLEFLLAFAELSSRERGGRADDGGFLNSIGEVLVLRLNDRTMVGAVCAVCIFCGTCV